MAIIEQVHFESGPPSDRMEAVLNYICIQGREADLLKLLRRGLNTWEPHPAWLDMLQAELTAMEAREKA